MKKSILALLFLFSTGIAFSQTTVTLQDQCNCEVLKGTDVSSSGATSPTGADLGDIYVNTNTGTIYFWDGDTWELTASDNQQLTGFTFNDATNTLSLTLENGGSVNVDLSSLSDTLMDSNTTVTSFGIDGTNTNLVITDSDLNTFSVALADLAALIDTNTDSQDLTGASLNGSNQLQIDIQNGASTTADLSSLDDSAGVAANATNIATNATNIANNASDISTNATNIATNTSDIADNAADISTNATNITTNATDIADHIAADGDLSSTNEIQNLGEVLADGNDGGGAAITNIADPTNAQDAATKAYVDSTADDDITGASLDAPSNVLTISEGTTDVTVDLSDLDDSAGVAANATNIATNATNIANNASDISTNATNIATNTSDIADNAADISTNATNITTNATDIADHIAADGDLSSTNEIQNLGEVLADGNDGGGAAITNIADPTNAQDAATKAYVDSTADDDITGASLDAPSNVLTISEGTTDVTVDLSDLDDSAGVAANATNIATNATNIANNASDISTNATNIATNTSDIADNAADISTNATNITTNATDIADHIAADGDLSSTNEIQNLGEVLADGNDGGGAAITNIADPTNAQDAATKAYVDSTADDDITGASLDAPSNVLTISEGTTDVTVDLSDLDDSAGVAANASDIATNATNIANNASDISTNATNIATNTSDIADNAADISTNATNITTNATDIADHVAADGDLSSTNEIQNLGEVLADGNDGGGAAITNIADPTNAQDAATKAYVDSTADDDITGASLDAPSNVLTISEGTTDVTVDLSDLDDSAGVAANATNIATNTSNIATNTSDIADNTADITTNATNIATNTSDIADNAADISTNATNITTNATDIADHVAADADTNIGNEYNTGSGITGGSLEITDGGGTESVNLISADANNNITAGSDGALYLNVASVSIAETNTTLSFDGSTNELSYTNELGNNPAVDMSSLDDSAGVAANASDIATNATNIANNASDISTNATNIATNTSDIADNAADIATNTSNIATNTSDIADNAADISTNATNITTNATDIADHIAADGDLSSTNEIQNIEEVLTDGNDANGLVLTGLGAPTAASDAATKAYVDSTADDDITGASLDAPSNVLTISEGTTDVTVDLSDLDDSAGVAANASDIATNATNIANNASDISTNATNIATNTSDIADNAADITTNATNIATNTSDIADNAADISTNATNITTNATDIADHIAADGDLSSTNEIQNIEEVLTDGNDANGLVLTGLGAPTAASDAATKAYVDSTADDDITGASLDAPSNVLTISEGTTDVTVDLSDLDDSAGVAANASDIATNATNIANNASDISTNATNIATNTSDIADNAADITTNATNIATNTSDIADNAADISTNATNITTNATDIADHIAADGDLSSTNEIQNIEEVLTDGNDANGLVLTGLGAPTAASDAATKAYVDSTADDDITGASLDAPSNVLTISEGTTDVTVDLSDLDDSAGVTANASDIATNATNIANNASDISTNATNIATNTSDIADNAADIATNTSNIATNTSDIADNAADIATNATNITTNATDIADHIAADGDLSSTNEIQNIEEVLTDGNDANGLVLTGLGAPTAASDAATKAYVDSTADDDITGASLDAPSNVLTISEGTTDVTVDLSDLDDSAGVAANASDIATNATNIANNASDISTNATNIATNTSDIADNAADITTNATNIATNTSDIADNAADISTNATNITTNATDIADHIAADGDLSSTNEIQNLGEVLADGNDGGGAAITNIADPTNAQDAATKAYVDSTADDDITGASLDAPSNVLTISEGTTDVTVDLSDLDDSAGVAANASDIATNATNIANNASDISTNATNIATNTSDIADNAADISTNATNITTNATDIADHIAADGDLSSTNEIQNIEEVLTDGNDANGLVLTGLGAPTAASDAATKAYVDSTADDDITGASLDAPSNVLTISEGTTDVTVDLSDLDDSAGVAANASDIATNATNIANNASDISTNATNIATNTSDIADNAADIATNTSNIATNTSDIADNAADIATNATNITTNATDIADHIAADGDLSSTNEIQNLGEVLADGNDGGGAAITNIADPTNAQDAATKAYVDSTADDDITGASLDAPSNVLTISEGTTDVTVDLSDLDDSAGVAANATNIATNATNIANNASDISTNATNIATNTSDIADNAADISTNATNITTNATDIADHIAADGDLSSTNEIQNLGEVLADGNDGGGAAITNIADPTNAQDAATKAYVDSTADDDITGASLDAPSNVLTISEGTTDVTVDLSDLDDSAGVAANATNIATNATNIANNASDISTNATNIATNTSDIADNAADISTNATNITTNATDIADHIAADGDLSSTNEIQNIEEVLTDGNDANGLVLTGLGAPTAASDAATKAYVDSTADDDITGASLDAPSNVLTISEGTTDVTVDLSDLDDSAGVAANATNIATNATNITTNATDIADHIAADGDLSSTNEIQNLGEVLADGNDGGGAAITNIADPTNAQDAATKAYVDSTADDDITGASLDAPSNVLTISEGTTDVTVDLSDLDDSAGVAANASDIATNATNIANNASDISTNATNIATNTSDIADNAADIATNATNITTNATDIADHIAADGDLSSTNEINTRFEVSGANLEIEDSNGTLQVALADIDTDDQTAAQVNSDSPVDVDGDGNTEATVEDVIQDIAPITSKAARIFYPPSIAIDASSNGTGRTVDLYAQYVAQYGTPAVSSAGAPTALPTYSAAELYYYVTYADPTVFDNMSIDANGVLTYDIIGQPADYNALINVVFVVK